MMRCKAAAPAVLLLALAVSGCVRAPAPAATPRLSAPDNGWVARTLKKMTVEEKVGQMIACRFTAEFRNGDSAYYSRARIARRRDPGSAA